ncbi:MULTISPECIES: phage holin family protein [Amniculibacterium]|uniref:phage holin family protein n=1 Tax=Amniculibacterium TaxID=2715289 RepID=UPI000F5A66CC|nr:MULTISPECIES: phage holin family protein [Amniculibacterium]
MLDVLKDYAHKKAELLKLEATEKTALTAGATTYFVLAAVVLLFFFILFNIGLGFLLATFVESYAIGFLIVAAIYLVLFFIVLMMKNTIKNSIANKIIQFINE